MPLDVVNVHTDGHDLLGFQMFDKGDTDHNWVTFRASMAEVLKLPGS